MAWFGGDMAGKAVGKRVAAHADQRRCCRGRDETVEHHREPAEARMHDRAGDCRQLPAAEAPQRLESGAAIVAMKLQRDVDDLTLMRHALARKTCARTGPVGAPATECCSGHGACGGCVSDAHFAQNQQVDA